MSVFLVRHAKAGDRATWEGPDALRPLTDAGWKQADGLAGLLGTGVDHVLSSPSVRCMQTIQPLANALGLKVEEHDYLAEGAGAKRALELVRDSDQSALCTHGDVIGEILETLSAAGIDLGPELRLKKASTWILELDSNGDVTSGRYLSPPG